MTETAVFIYTTPKRGRGNHKAPIPEGARIGEAWSWVRLFELPEGII